MVLMLSPVVPVAPQPPHACDRKRKRARDVVERVSEKSMDELAREVRSSFEAPLELRSLLAMSTLLERQYQDKLQRSNISMLPSYQHILPTGLERGDCLALDVGGSTFRIALIRLLGKTNGEEGLQTKSIRSFAIDKSIRDLKGQQFFDWMADRIAEMLDDYYLNIDGATITTLPMGLTWSFPVEQTSPKSGRILTMGKGFYATQGVEGQDLSELIMKSCRRKGLKVEMQAIINDSAATLLSQAYRDPSTRMSLILGTGTNAAVYLPVSALAHDKFGSRPQSWHEAAKYVLVNTELSMFGKHVLQTTRWDEELNRKHVLPDFQPLEYMVTGRYLAEIVRLILVEAINTIGLFDGQMPERLYIPYAFDTKILAGFESDSSPSLANACTAFMQAHPLRRPPTHTELQFIRTICQAVSRRAAAYLATALHALWRLRTDLEQIQPGESGSVTIACNGTIVEKYPEFRVCCQRYLDELCVLSGASAGSVALEMAPESSILGAAVAVCCNE
ncbi:actin-like ATPase domain-containing protein [Polychaeton citri CBS 116435]|uniref:Phosphotransferase n=1 Tax=Polychaeton citri CBS 116435 TaxID=1314669 RepID=A0A9P4UKA8_9PEZI|nr:actin-like ATPase domain-containing protein [Polychaeton citri CBS 116435]